MKNRFIAGCVILLLGVVVLAVTQFFGGKAKAGLQGKVEPSKQPATGNSK